MTTDNRNDPAGAIPFYKDHWVNIDQQRFDRYQQMFTWNPDSAVLYEAADIQAGQVVVEFGCGPGHTAIEMARWVGGAGHVHALDINTEFVGQCHDNAAKAGLADQISVHWTDGTNLPLQDNSVDRVSMRNTLIFVDDPLATLSEFMRVLRPGGKLHAIEGDWPMMVVEPIATTTWQRLVAEASVACRTPDIGRKLRGLLTQAGFHEVAVQVITRPDLTGRLLPMISNMAGYAVNGGRFSSSDGDAIRNQLDAALRDDTYLALAPQFVVTGDC